MTRLRSRFNSLEESLFGRPRGGAGNRRRWLRRALIVLVLLETGYLVLANIGLHSSVGQKLANRRPDQFQISWSSAWSFWPGAVHLRNVHMKIQDRRTRWELELDRARLGVSLPALVLRRVDMRSITGNGLAFRLLRRPKPGERPPSDAAPVISGFPGPLESPAASPPPQPENPWRLSFSGIDVEEVREVWLEDERYLGDGRLTGGLEVEVLGPIRIEPSVLDLAPGRILNGDDIVAEDARLTVEVRSDRFDPREHRDRTVLRFLSGRVRFDSPRTAFGFLDSYFSRAPWLSVGGTGEVTADVSLGRGKIASGSQVTVEARELSLEAVDLTAEGRGRIRVAVSEAEGGAETRLTATFEDFGIVDDPQDGEGGEPLVRGTGLELVARGSDTDLAGEFGHAEAEVVIPRSEVPDLSAFNDYLPSASDLQIRSGRGDFEGRMALDSKANSATGELEIRGEGVGIELRGVDVVGDLRVSARLRGADLQERRYDISGSRIDLEHFRVAHAESGAEETDWWARIDLREGEVRMRDPPGLSATLVAEIRDSAPLAAYLAEKKPVIGWFQDLLTVEDVSLEGRLVSGPDTLAINEVRIAGESLEILATALHLSHGNRDGLFFFKLGVLAAALEVRGRDRHWNVTRPRRWYESRSAAEE